MTEEEKSQETVVEELTSDERIALLNREVERLKNALNERSDLELRNLRLQADMDNLRKRTAREKEEWWQLASADMLLQLLPVVDSFERALAALPEGASNDWAKGIFMVGRQFQDTLTKMGLEPICATETLFDPQCHEAVMQDRDSDMPENTITAEFERGYSFRGRVIRPSKVRVSTGGNNNE